MRQEGAGIPVRLWFIFNPLGESSKHLCRRLSGYTVHAMNAAQDFETWCQTLLLLRMRRLM